MHKLENYRGIVEDNLLYSLYQRARKLYGKRILNINSTSLGGGVAEILNSIIPLMNSIGVYAGWRVLHGNPDFFNTTKKLHNGIQGQKYDTLSCEELKIYDETNESFSKYTHVNHDLVVIHDPQPLPLIQYCKKMQPWIWRCHIDASKNNNIIEMLKNYIIKYDKVIVSSEKYIMKDFPVPYKIMAPAIDPFSSKNKDLYDINILKILKSFKIPTNKPLITQVSRFDKWKDPLGVISIFEKVLQNVDCRLVLCGSMAADDPEGLMIYEKVKKEAKYLIEKGYVILTTVESNLLVNALQRASSVIIQKSIKEGFGLTVTESLWKKKPVVASNIGGIPLQIEDGVSGFLVDPLDINIFADKVIEILKNPKLAYSLGAEGCNRVKNKFLITRLLEDYLDLFISFL